MISVEAFSQLLSVLYAAPLHPPCWEQFLDLLCEYTGTKSGFLVCVNSRFGPTVQAQNSARVLTTPAVETYCKEIAPGDPYRLPMLRSETVGLMDCEALVSTAEVLKSDFYRQIIAPAGLRHPSLILITRSIERLEGMSFWRTAEEGPMPAEGDRLLALVAPHVRAAIEISYTLGVFDARAQSAEAMADASETPTFLLGANSQLFHANAAARELLLKDDGLTVVQGRLCASKQSARRSLSSLLAGLQPHGRDIFHSAPLALALERPSRRSALQLLASPVPGKDGKILLLATDPEKPVVLRSDALREHYGMTAAETEIANGLLTGYSLEEIAAVRRVTIGTVRNQIKSMFAKTGTSKQADLVRKILSLPRIAT